MTVERIDLSSTLGASPGYAYVARATGTIVCTAGAVPLDKAGNLIGAGDLETQTSAVIDNLAVALQGGGAAPDDVIKTTIYVVGERSSLTRAWDVFSGSPFVGAPSTLVGVTHLGYEGQLVEIEATAVVS